MTYISMGDDTVISDTPLRRPSDRGWIMRGGSASNRATIITSSFLMGLAIGTAAWAFLYVMHIGISLVWGPDPLELGILRPLVVCLVGGIAIGLFSKHFKQHPEGLLAVVSKVRRNGRYEREGIGKRGVAALMPLVFGGSVGPEAGLTGFIAGICTLAKDRLMGMMSRIGEDCTGKKWKVSVAISATAGALISLTALVLLLGGGLSIPRYHGISYGAQELVWIIPLTIIGALSGLLFRALDTGFGKVSEKIGDKPVTKAVVAGLVLATVGIALPYVMFSGEMQTGSLRDMWTAVPAVILLSTAFVKIAVTAMCVNMEWRGGQFYPLIFSGISMGYGLSSAFGVDPVFCLCACTTALVGGVLRRPILTVLLLLLCFPMNCLPVLVVSALIGSYFPMPKAMFGTGGNSVTDVNMT